MKDRRITDPTELANRHPRAIQENHTLRPSQTGTPGQPELPYRDRSRLASDRAAISPTASRRPARSAGRLRELVRENRLASISDVAARRLLIEQRRLRYRRIRRTMLANPVTWRPQSIRAKIEFRVRSVLRRAPLPVQQLVEHIYPRFSPRYVMPLNEYIKGLES